MIDELTNEELAATMYDYEQDYTAGVSYLTREANDARVELVRRADEGEKLRELAEAAHVVARMYGETLCQGNEGRDFLDAVDAVFPKEADE
jgi:hypothetical protein